jgi:hypothetical protein
VSENKGWSRCALDFFFQSLGLTLPWQHYLLWLWYLYQWHVNKSCQKVQQCHELVCRGDLSSYYYWLLSEPPRRLLHTSNVVQEFNATYCRTFKLAVELACMHSTNKKQAQAQPPPWWQYSVACFLAMWSSQTRRWNEWSREEKKKKE